MGQSYLSLGDMLTFIGLIVAAFQLVKPRYSLIWKLTDNLIKSVAILLLVIGYVSPLISILIPNTRGQLDGLALDALLQITGFISITIGLLVVVYIYSRFNYRHLVTVVPKVRFHFQRYPKKRWRNLYFHIERNKVVTTRSAKKFYEITSLFLVRGHVGEVVEITRLNLKPLVHAALQYMPRWQGMPGEESRKPPEPNGANYTYETLYQLLTDKVAMKHICTNDRFFLHAIVGCEVDDSDGSRNEFANVLYTNIVEHLVLNPESFLYAQREDHDGTARFANVYDLLTDDRIVRRQHIIPSMLTWNMSKADVSLDEYTEVLLKLLERMVDSYKKQPGSVELFSNIRQIFDQLIGDSGITRRLAFDKKARQQYADDVVSSVGFKVLSKIHLSMTTSLLFKDNDPDNFKKDDTELKAVNTRSAYEQKTLTGLLAHKVYELIEDLTIFYQDTDDPDGNLLREILFYISIHVYTPVAIRYEELLWERLFDKAIDGKLEPATNIAGYYPNIFRFIIKYLVPFANHQLATEQQAGVRLKHIMANELKEALLTGKRMGNDEPLGKELLPANIEAKVNKKKMTVEYYYIEKDKKTLIDLSTEVESQS
ncbi:MAG TPA: hypothetical protein VLG92_03770 [Candidatus Saccharimonadia bacterium]|nr:hypothetical protein [Candidatus Saccharimonadia bacterium]